MEEGVSTPTRKHKPILEKGVVPYPHNVLSFSPRRAVALESQVARVQQPGLDTSRVCKPPGLLSSDIFYCSFSCFSKTTFLHYYKVFSFQ